jgi:hypothetical protein
MGVHPMPRNTFFYSQVFVFFIVFVRTLRLVIEKKVNNPDKLSGLLFPQGLFSQVQP